MRCKDSFSVLQSSLEQLGKLINYTAIDGADVMIDVDIKLGGEICEFANIAM